MACEHAAPADECAPPEEEDGDRKSTRLNSSHQIISYAVFRLKKKSQSERGRHLPSHRVPGLGHLMPYVIVGASRQNSLLTWASLLDACGCRAAAYLALNTGR